MTVDNSSVNSLILQSQSFLQNNYFVYLNKQHNHSCMIWFCWSLIASTLYGKYMQISVTLFSSTQFLIKITSRMVFFPFLFYSFQILLIGRSGAAIAGRVFIDRVVGCLNESGHFLSLLIDIYVLTNGLFTIT